MERMRVKYGDVNLERRRVRSLQGYDVPADSQK